MTLSFPELMLYPDHMKSVRLYLSHIHQQATPFSQADMAKLFSCSNLNSYAKWERQVNTVPDMLLRLMQVQIHFEHQKLNMYENDEQSIGLFMSFHQKPSSLLVPPPAQANLNPALSKALYDAAWAFGHSFKTDGFDWGLFANGALTITPAFGATHRIRAPFIYMVDELLRKDGEPPMSQQDINRIRAETSGMRPGDEQQVVKTEFFDVVVKDNSMEFQIKGADRKRLLEQRFEDAGKQARTDMAPQWNSFEFIAAGRSVLTKKCTVGDDPSVLQMRNFIGTDMKAKFTLLTHLESAMYAQLGKQPPRPENSAGHQLWKALRNGEQGTETDMLDLALDKRHLTIRIKRNVMQLFTALRDS